MMWRAAFLVSVAALGAGFAQAADMPPQGALPGAAAPVLTWDGFYTGFDFGYQHTRARVREPSARGRYPLDGYGGGSFIGRNWQFGSVVAGLEGYINIYETKGDLRIGPTTGAQGDHLWSAGVKGRLGYSVGAFLPFVTAGIATTEFHQHSAIRFQDGDVRQHHGVTAGAGLEYAWTPGISTRIEYEYSGFGRKTYLHDGVPHRVSLDGHAFKAALVLRESRDGPATGFLSALLGPGRGYGGVLAGYSWGESDFKRPGGARTRIEIDGGEAGIFGGYDLLFAGGWFVGYDSFVNLSSVSGRGAGAAGPIAIDILWSGATRARAGISWGAFSPYLAGGFALAQEEATSVATGERSLEMHYGATIGAGIDYALTDRWFTRAEYAYTSYQRNRPKLDSAVNGLTTDQHRVQFGLGYRM